jgi:hypothetical protein
MKKNVKKSNYEINFNLYEVRTEGGAIDREATLAKFEQDLDTRISANSADYDKIQEVVDSVLEKYNAATTKLNVTFVVSQATQLLNPTPTTYSDVSERVHSFITENSRADDSRYYVPRGRGESGVMLRDDYLVLQAAKVKTEQVAASK